MKLFIEGRRNGYSPDQCGQTMTVGELKEFLEQYDDSMEIFLRNDNGYTYGNITYSSFSGGGRCLACGDELEEYKGDNGEKFYKCEWGCGTCYDKDYNEVDPDDYFDETKQND